MEYYVAFKDNNINNFSWRVPSIIYKGTRGQVTKPIIDVKMHYHVYIYV